jgi:hypothetical protein
MTHTQVETPKETKIEQSSFSNSWINKASQILFLTFYWESGERKQIATSMTV